jgi:hypothetical protein
VHYILANTSNVDYLIGGYETKACEYIYTYLDANSNALSLQMVRVEESKWNTAVIECTTMYLEQMFD